MSPNQPSKWALEQANHNALRAQVAALSTRGAYQPPIVAADPPLDTGVMLWMFADGRLRGRRADTGAVVEFQRMSTPGGTTGPDVPGDWTEFPVTKQAEWAASWMRSFGVDGTPVEPTGVYGHAQRTLVGFPRAAILATIGDAVEITSVELALFNRSAEVDPVEIRAYTHTETSAPGYYGPASGGYSLLTLPAVGGGFALVDRMAWVDLAVTATGGYVIDQGADEALAGRLGTTDDESVTPLLRITYRAYDSADTEQV